MWFAQTVDRIAPLAQPGRTSYERARSYVSCVVLLVPTTTMIVGDVDRTGRHGPAEVQSHGLVKAIPQWTPNREPGSRRVRPKPPRRHRRERSGPGTAVAPTAGARARPLGRHTVVLAIRAQHPNSPVVPRRPHLHLDPGRGAPGLLRLPRNVNDIALPRVSPDGGLVHPSSFPRLRIVAPATELSASSAISRG